MSSLTTPSSLVFDNPLARALRFDKAIELIAKGGWIRLGTRPSADDPSTIEWKLQEHAKKLYGRKTDFKIAPHIADILVLSGIAKSVCRTLQLRRRKV